MSNRSAGPAPFLDRLTLVPERIEDRSAYPFALPLVRDLQLEFSSAVTFFVGENGSGKSTVLEALAHVLGFPAAGGGRNEIAGGHAPAADPPLARALRPSRRRRIPDGYFFRADFHGHFASLLDQREGDPEFRGDPYTRYGGRSLHTRSHGESFLALMQNRIGDGLYLMDEPESALSPQRQLELLATMALHVQRGATQFIVATHSPILMTFPGAALLSFDDVPVQPITPEETSHVQLTRLMLDAPEHMWRRLWDELECDG